jgi:hypothetical protein
MLVNGAGALATGVVAVVVGIAKLALGAWAVLVLIPVLVSVMWTIRSHYLSLAASERPETPLEPERVRPRVIVPIASLNVPARQALAFGQAFAGDDAVSAVHVIESPDEAASFRAEWEQSPHGGLELVIIESPYRALARPLIAFVDEVARAHPDNTIVVVLPEFVHGSWWENLLHNQTALRLKAALLFHRGVIVASVPYHLSRRPAVARS